MTKVDRHADDMDDERKLDQTLYTRRKRANVTAFIDFTTAKTRLYSLWGSLPLYVFPIYFLKYYASQKHMSQLFSSSFFYYFFFCSSRKSQRNAEILPSVSRFQKGFFPLFLLKKQFFPPSVLKKKFLHDFQVVFAMESRTNSAGSVQNDGACADGKSHALLVYNERRMRQSALSFSLPLTPLVTNYSTLIWIYLFNIFDETQDY